MILKEFPNEILHNDPLDAANISNKIYKHFRFCMSGDAEAELDKFTYWHPVVQELKWLGMEIGHTINEIKKEEI